MYTGGISRLELFSLMVASLGHDVGHPGIYIVCIYLCMM